MLKPNDPPASPEKIRFACPNCQVKVAAPMSFSGKRMRCPKCRETVSVPQAPASLPPRFTVEPGPSDIPPPLSPPEGMTDLPELPDEGLLLGRDWLVFRCPSCKGTTKVRRVNFDKLVACGVCQYEFSVGIS